MANRQTIPNAITPVNGDVETAVGSPSVTVTGIQSIPVDPATPQPQQILVMGSDGTWHPEDPVVSGTDAPGAPSTKNPVQVAGIDDGNLVREVRTDTYGAVQLSEHDRKLLRDLVNTLKAVLRAVVDSNSSLKDSDYVADLFDNVDPMQ